eukprot:GDKJ01057680.1.p1 GENE.GDKJ01057680.1~~GDKJ01057680.1.p1  ORF type:complete len:449 (-),score=103.77 GDKJ01057680.1:50-1396(-)
MNKDEQENVSTWSSTAQNVIEPVSTTRLTFDEARKMLREHQYQTLSAVASNFIRNDNISVSDKSKWKVIRAYCLLCNCKASILETELNMSIDELLASTTLFPLQLIWAMLPCLLRSTAQGDPQPPLPSNQIVDFSFGFNKTIDRLYTLFDCYSTSIVSRANSGLSTRQVLAKIFNMNKPNSWGLSEISELSQSATGMQEDVMTSTLSNLTQIPRADIIDRLIWISRLLTRMMAQQKRGGSEQIVAKLGAILKGEGEEGDASRQLGFNVILSEMSFFNFLFRGDLQGAKEVFSTRKQFILSAFSNPKKQKAVEDAFELEKILLSASLEPSTPVEQCYSNLLLLLQQKSEASSIEDDLQLSPSSDHDLVILAHDASILGLQSRDLTRSFSLLQSPLWSMNTTKVFVQPFVVRTMSSLYEFSTNKVGSVGVLRELLSTGVPEDEGAAWCAN